MTTTLLSLICILSLNPCLGLPLRTLSFWFMILWKNNHVKIIPVLVMSKQSHWGKNRKSKTYFFCFYWNYFHRYCSSEVNWFSWLSSHEWKEKGQLLVWLCIFKSVLIYFCWNIALLHILCYVFIQSIQQNFRYGSAACSLSQIYTYMYMLLF